MDIELIIVLGEGWTTARGGYLGVGRCWCCCCEYEEEQEDGEVEGRGGMGSLLEWR